MDVRQEMCSKERRGDAIGWEERKESRKVENENERARRNDEKEDRVEGESIKYRLYRYEAGGKRERSEETRGSKEQKWCGNRKFGK